jgi:hypothetical protein
MQRTHTGIYPKIILSYGPCPKCDVMEPQHNLGAMHEKTEQHLNTWFSTLTYVHMRPFSQEGNGEIHLTFQYEAPRKRSHFAGVDRRIVLKCIIENLGVRVWLGFI